MKLSDVSAFFDRMAVYWPKFESSPVIFKTYCQMFALEQATEGELMAVSEYLRREAREYYPAPGAADVTRALKEIRSHTPGKKKSTPEEKWAILCDLAARGKTWEEVSKKCTERTKYAVRSIGGWEKIRLSPTDGLVFVRRDFLAAYSQLTVRDSQHECLEYSTDQKIINLVDSTTKKITATYPQHDGDHGQNKIRGLANSSASEVVR